MDNQFLDFKIIDIKETTAVLNQCTGNLEKGIFICYNSLTATEETLLSKILSAVKLDLNEDVLLLKKTKDNHFSFGAFNQQQSIQKAILFGVPSTEIGINVNYQKYQPFNLNRCQFLFADDLSTIANQQNLKKLLWNALKEMFN